MLTFNEYDDLTEALITFAGKAYPKFGNVVIMAGGAGSGKGFVLDKLVGMEGFKFDVDELKKLAMKAPLLNKRVEAEFGVKLSDLNLKEPNDVFKMHAIIGDALKLDDKKAQSMYTSVMAADPDRKPNLIFDVTLKDLRKLESITRAVKNLGYSNEKIHIVWVVNDIEIAKAQNAKRDRTVPVEILVNTHRGVSATMNDIVRMGKQLDRYMDGDIVFAFNKVGVDTEVKTSGRGGMFVVDADYFYVKKSGKKPISFEKISNEIKRKISDYVPKDASWA